MTDKLKLAYLTPMLPAKSGIADYSHGILPYLAEKFDIELYPVGDAKFDHPRVRLHRIDSFNPLNQKDKSDLILYQIGNNRLHGRIYLSAILKPGLVMLHEFLLHHLIKALTIGTGDLNAYTAEMENFYGLEGAEISRLVHTGRAATETLYFHYPMFQRITERSRGIITTTEYSKKMILRYSPDKYIRSVPISIDVNRNYPNKIKARKQLGLDNFFTIGTFGLISTAKEIDLILDVAVSLNRRIPQLRLILAGRVDPFYNLKEALRKRDIERITIATGYLEREAFDQYLSSTDICINLRYPTGGESSAALLDMMNASKAVIVPEYAQFLEFPDDVVIHLPPGRDKKEILEKIIIHFYENSNQLQEIGIKASAYCKKHHNHEAAANQLADVLFEYINMRITEPKPMKPEERDMFTRLLKRIELDKNFITPDLLIPNQDQINITEKS